MFWLLTLFSNVFRKKDYLEITYKEANSFGTEFKEVNQEILTAVYNIIEELDDATSIPNQLSKLTPTRIDAESFPGAVAEILNRDYQKTYFEAISNNWNFNYFVSYLDTSNKEFISICNKLQSSQNKQIGEVMYPILVLGKFQGQLLLWDLLEDYDAL